MQLQQAKEKLEFDRVLERCRKHSASDLGLKQFDAVPFYTDSYDLQRELDRVLQMKELINFDGDLDFSGLKDISGLLERVKIEGFYITPEQFLWVLDFLRVSRRLINYFKKKERENSDKFPILIALAKPLYSDSILEHNIEITIDETGRVKDSASAELRKIRREIQSKEENLRKTLSKILRTYSEKEYSQEDIVTQRDGRFVIPVKIENKKSVPGIVHSTSSTGATVFIEPGETIEYNNDIAELQFKEKREVEKILRDLSGQVADNYEPLKVNVEVLADLDYLHAKAKYGIETISTKPIFDEKVTDLRNAYHPVLLQNHPRKEVEPLNLKIGEDYNTLVVTGPNAGGKTVALKTVGLLQLMLQSGMLIPVDDKTSMRLFDKIFINIGDEQSIENDLSTFSSHLASLKDIVDNADENSLILIDEICSGTDPSLGSALSSAILKDFSARDAVSIVTTHIGELKKFAYNTDKIENASLEFDHKTLSPSFRFVTGVPGQSFTFEIAAKFDYPPELLDTARSYTDGSEAQLEDLIKELNENKQKYAEFKNKYDRENTRLNGLINIYEQKNEKLEEDKKKIINTSKQEAKQILADANKLVEKTIKEIREKQNFSPKEVKDEFAKKTQELTGITEDAGKPGKSGKNEEKDAVSNETPKVNDYVKLKDSTTTGQLIELSGSQAVINANGITLKVSLSSLEKISGKQAKKSYNEDSATHINTEPASRSLDIRGHYAGEITTLVENFLNDAHINGLKEVSIVHGKGTGSLRKEVGRILKSISLVKSSRLGTYHEGDTGVTIVEL